MIDALEKVILVDENDNELGLMEKLQAHELGILHRAFSVFIFNSDNQMLLQKRASVKYHSPDLWTNACCSHPRKGETVLEAASRRLEEEMGLVTDLKVVGHIIYKANLDRGLIENEYDYILIGITDEKPILNPEEVGDFEYKDLNEIEAEISINPNRYTEWFKLIFPSLPNYV